MVRKVSPLGVIETVAGTGVGGYNGDGVQATQADLNGPTDAVELKDGEYLIADRGNHRIRMVSPNGVIETVAGTGATGFSGDDGPATSGELHYPTDISPLDGCAFLFVDEGNRRIRRVESAGTSRPLRAGERGALGDGGPATDADCARPASRRSTTAGS